MTEEKMDTRVPDAEEGLPSVVEVDINRLRISLLPGANSSGASFQFENEDHTLGNALRYIIMKNPAVEFCGYSIPHPSENKMNLRIQTFNGVTPSDALKIGLKDLEDLCDMVSEQFARERDRFNESRILVT